MMATTAEISRPWKVSAMAGCLKLCSEQASRRWTRRMSTCAIGSFQRLAVCCLALLVIFVVACND